MTDVIQVLKPKFRVEEVLLEIRECLEKGWTGIGFKTVQFEDAWKAYSGFSYAHFLNSATAGLHLAVKIFKEKLSWEVGDEIITTSLTFVSTNHAILYEGLVPVFADVNESLCLDPTSVEEAISSRTRAVIYVGVGGNSAHYKEIRKICAARNLVFILDAAHMAGTRWADSTAHVGLDADCAIFSYQAVKNCPSADAGMICFQDIELDGRARSLSWLGIDKSTYSRYSESFYKWRYDVTDLGFKYHGNSIQAAMCLVSLRYLEGDNDYRRSIASVYDDFLLGAPGLTVIRHSPDITSSRHLYQIIVDNRDNMIDMLAQEGIFCGVHYIANTSYALYRRFRSYSRTAELLSDKLISLPLHLDVTIDDAARVAQLIRQ